MTSALNYMNTEQVN